MAAKKSKRKKTNAAKNTKKTTKNKRTKDSPRAKTKKVSTKRKAAPRTKSVRRRVRGQGAPGELVSYEARGLGARAGGQSGDIQGLPVRPDVDSESVEELLEEGQSFEAEVVDGVENAPEPDQGEIRTREVEEDDVPEEYQGPEEDREKH